MNNLKLFISRISGLGIDDSLDNHQIVKIRILNVICFVVILVITFLYSLRDILFGRYDLAFYHFLLVFLFIPPLILNRANKHNSARLFLFIGFPVSLVPYNYFLSDIGAENFLFSLVLLSFLLLDDNRTKFVISFYCASVFIFIKFLLHNEISLSYYAESAEELFYFNTSQSFILVTIFSFIYSYQNNEHHKKLEKANEELLTNNQLIKSLLGELNHRVKNNLQMVSSMFNIQSLSADNPILKEKLGEASFRMQALALVYEKLYDKKTNFEIRLDTYLKEHLSKMIETFFIDIPLKTDIQIPSIVLSLEETIHIGLIINELITNIYKYGLSYDETNIKVLITLKDNSLELLVSDNGPGLSKGFDPYTICSFGYELIRILVEKYEGTIKVFNDEGTKVIIALRMDLQIPSENNNKAFEQINKLN